MFKSRTPKNCIYSDRIGSNTKFDETVVQRENIHKLADRFKCNL